MRLLSVSASRCMRLLSVSASRCTRLLSVSASRCTRLLSVSASRCMRLLSVSASRCMRLISVHQFWALHCVRACGPSSAVRNVWSSRPTSHMRLRDVLRRITCLLSGRWPVCNDNCHTRSSKSRHRRIGKALSAGLLCPVCSDHMRQGSV